MSRRKIILPAVVALFVALSASAAAEQQSQKAQKGRFLRLTKDDAGSPLALEAAVVRYEAADSEQRGLKVDLISAVHVADRSYYQELNRLFKTYDAVLYELVAPAGTRVPKNGGTGGNPVSMLCSTKTAPWR
jgi:hypothetical protein